MYPSPFKYHRPATIEEAVALFSAYEEASFLAGGHTLIPAMKNRLSAPQALIDLRGVECLSAISKEGRKLTIGATATHAVVSVSKEVRESIPALAKLAGSIGDPQVRNVGTIGGSVANNDPSADYPSALLGLGATIITNARRIAADDFFVGLFTTALEPGEIIVAIEVALPDAAGYAKICSQASRYAVAGSFVARHGNSVRVAITGAGQDGVFRWIEAEEVLTNFFDMRSLDGLLPDAETLVADLHGGADYRSHLVAEVTRRAVGDVSRH